jgi:hypothetical protein
MLEEVEEREEQIKSTRGHPDINKDDTDDM